MQTLERNIDDAEARGSINRSLFSSAASLFQGAGFYYVMLAVLILKIMWGAWDFKDIDWGDTISYYSNACETFDRGRVNIAWSPLFALFGSLILRISHEQYFYCMATRFICEIAVAMLTLGVMRRLLPAGLAWFAAAWWAVLPINFDTLYQVHLFGVIPILVTWLLLLGKEDSRGRRGIALSVMLGSGILIRNEQCVYAALFATAVVIAETMSFFRSRQSTEFGGRKLERSGSGASIWSVLKPYLVPLCVVAALVTGCYVRSTVRYPELAGFVRYKHTNNVGQIFTYGFQQRNPGVYNKTPWRDYGEMMTKYFGAPELTITEAFSRNPLAMTEHFLWNASLIPSGLQLLLFSKIAGKITPDYIEPPRDALGANLLTAAVLVIIGAGLFAALRNWRSTRDWLWPRRWAVTAMGCYAVVAFVVMVMQRPRASYVFALGIELMALTGFCLWQLFRSTALKDIVARACPLAMILLIASAPAYYPPRADGRPLLTYVELLKPFALVMEYDDNGKILVPKYAHEIGHYLYGTNIVPFETRMIAMDDLPDITRGGIEYLALLKKNAVREVLFDQPTHSGPSPCERAIIASPQWRLLALRKKPDRTLSLYSMSTLYESSK